MALPPPDPDLTVAAIYERDVRSSLDRVWENVLDSEHLPWLHARTFDSIDELDAGDWGWRAKIGGAGPDGGSVVELSAERDAGRYVVRTGEGGAKSEIWTTLEPRAADVTHVSVEFRVTAGLAADALRAVGAAYVSLYTMLWDEDEEMMSERATRLAEQALPPADTRTDLGTESELRARLPIDVVFEGHRFQVVDHDGRLIAHATVCPHMLGPLFAADGAPGILECPWHGYSFDTATGRSCDGRGLRLPAAPEVSLEAVPGRCTLVPGRSHGAG